MKFSSLRSLLVFSSLALLPQVALSDSKFAKVSQLEEALEASGAGSGWHTIRCDSGPDGNEGEDDVFTYGAIYDYAQARCYFTNDRRSDKFYLYMRGAGPSFHLIHSIIYLRCNEKNTEELTRGGKYYGVKALAALMVGPLAGVFARSPSEYCLMGGMLTPLGVGVTFTALEFTRERSPNHRKFGR